MAIELATKPKVLTGERLISGMLLIGILSCLTSCRNFKQSADVSRPTTQPGSPLFLDKASELGIQFQMETEKPGSYFMPEIMGSGCALLDFDRDGDLDVLLVNLGTGYVNDEPRSATMHRLYEQTAPQKFEDVSARAGFFSSRLGMGVAVGDVNNDGWPDVYFSNFGPDQLFLNQRDGRFVDVTEDSGVQNLHWGASTCFVDYDRDGWLDLFVVNYVDYTDRPCTRVGGGGRDYCGPQVFPGTSARLFRNLTGETSQEAGATNDTIRPVSFRDVSDESGISKQSGPGLGVAVADWSGDGLPDFYVANDQTANFLWINQQNGQFIDEAISRGCAYDGQGNAQASMGVAVGDPDGDGDIDLFVTHLDGEYSTLYLRQESGLYVDGTQASGLAAMTRPYTGFGTAFADVDLDGDEDLIQVNGRVKRPDVALGATSPSNGSHDYWSPYRQKCQLLLNDGHAKFQEIDLEPGNHVSRGLAVGDIDNDGDLDLLINRTGEPAALLLNTMPRRGNWVRIRIVDSAAGGRDVYDAVVTVVAGDRNWVRLLQPGTSYLSSQDPRIHVGVGQISELQRFDVRWPDGTETSFPASEVNREYTLERSSR